LSWPLSNGPGERGRKGKKGQHESQKIKGKDGDHIKLLRFTATEAEKMQKEGREKRGGGGGMLRKVGNHTLRCSTLPGLHWWGKKRKEKGERGGTRRSQFHCRTAKGRKGNDRRKPPALISRSKRVEVKLLGGKVGGKIPQKATVKQKLPPTHISNFFYVLWRE